MNKTKKTIIEENSPKKKKKRVDSKIITLSLGWIITAIILVAVLVLNRIPKLENGKEVVASIDGLSITADEYYSELKVQGGYTVLNDLIDKFIANKEIPDNNDAIDYADATIKSYQFSYKQSGKDFNKYIESIGYTLEQIKNDFINDYKINAAAEKHIKSKITEKEIEDYYDNYIYEKLTVRHILIKSNATAETPSEEKDALEKVALEKALEIIKKYKNGEDFIELAKTYSEDEGTKNDGGLFSNFDQSNTDVNFFKAANQLKDGEITEYPILSQYGYHIILKVSNNGKPSLEDSKEKILNSVLDIKLEDDENLIDKAWAELREKYNLQIFDNKLNGIYKSMIESIKNS